MMNETRLLKIYYSLKSFARANKIQSIIEFLSENTNDLLALSELDCAW